MIMDHLKNGPTFIYDLDRLSEHLNLLQKNCGDEIKLWYACKANPLSSIIKELKNHHFQFDVASSGELVQVLSCDVSPQHILATGPGKNATFFQKIFEKKISTIVIESFAQLEMSDRYSKMYQHFPNILLRLQLEWNETEKSVLGGSSITPFGMDDQEAKRCLEFIPKTKLNFLGFHVFQWGNILVEEKLFSIWKKTLLHCKKLFPEFSVMDFGGGLGISYDQEHFSKLSSFSPLNWEKILSQLKILKNECNLKEIWLELGRFAVGPFGIYAATITEIKSVFHKKIIIIDGGIHHLARPALVQESFPCEILQNINNKNGNPSTYSVHGPLCTALDHLGDYPFDETPKTGDTLLFFQTGAYGFTESMPYFLGHTLPSEIIMKNGIHQIIRPHQEASQWMK